MALFGFNKQKVLASAEKYVQQGKLQNAISEYEKVLKNDAKDLTVNNTVGDLYSRLGETDKAVECFKSVGDAYAGQGFTVKAIAMYKKICKLKSSLESLLKLEDLRLGKPEMQGSDNALYLSWTAKSHNGTGNCPMIERPGNGYFTGTAAMPVSYGAQRLDQGQTSRQLRFTKCR